MIISGLCLSVVTALHLYRGSARSPRLRVWELATRRLQVLLVGSGISGAAMFQAATFQATAGVPMLRVMEPMPLRVRPRP